MDWRGMDLAAFARRDEMRRAVGRMLDEAGWGAIETDSRVVFREPPVRLKAYGGSPAGPVLLLVPAPIKRAYIWDLAPHCSVVRRALRAGHRVCVLEWEAPGEHGLGLEDHADRLIGGCLDAVSRHTGERAVFVAGHSLGGTLAAIFATLHPERVRGLILLGAPLSFEAGTNVFGPLVSEAAMREVTARGMPGSLLNAVTFLAAPFTIGCTPWLDRVASSLDSERVDTLMRVERWAHDEMALSGPLVADFVQAFLRENAFVAGCLELGGRLAAPARLNAPVLAVVDPRCSLVPPGTVEPFLRAVGSRDAEMLRYSGDRGVLLQHVGMLVGPSAHRGLWPRILDWIGARADRPDG